MVWGDGVGAILIPPNPVVPLQAPHPPATVARGGVQRVRLAPTRRACTGKISHGLRGPEEGAGQAVAGRGLGNRANPGQTLTQQLADTGTKWRRQRSSESRERKLCARVTLATRVSVLL